MSVSSLPLIWLIGYYQEANYGDDLLLQSALQLLAPYDLHIKVVPIRDLERTANEATYAELQSLTHIILFGGAVLNEYFLQPLRHLMLRYALPSTSASVTASVCTERPWIHAVGVSSDTTYVELSHYMPLFDVVVARNRTDQIFWELWKSQTLDTDLWHSTKSGDPAPQVFEGPQVWNAVDPVFGMELEPPLVITQGLGPYVIFIPCGMNTTTNESLLWLEVLRTLVQGLNVVLCPFGTGKAEENDEVACSELFRALTVAERSRVHLRSSPQNLDFSNCVAVASARFHGLVLGLKYGKPVLGLRDTPKCRSLLSENGLSAFLLHSTIGVEEASGWIQSTCCSLLATSMQKKAHEVSKKTQDQAQRLYKTWAQTVALTPCRSQTFTPLPCIAGSLCSQEGNISALVSTLESHLCGNTLMGRSDFAAALASALLVLLVGNPEAKYHWGLSQTIRDRLPSPQAFCEEAHHQTNNNGIQGGPEASPILLSLLHSLRPQLQFILETEMLGGSRTLPTRLQILGQSLYTLPREPQAVNVTFRDQSTKAKLHRFGWSSVYEALVESGLVTSNANALWLDLYLDQTFHWQRDALVDADMLPYKQPWAGFVHHTFMKGYNSHNLPNNSWDMLQDPIFCQSLETCVALCVLSRYLCDLLTQRLRLMGFPHIPVFYVPHPLPKVSEGSRFRSSAFAAKTPRTVVQIGAWYRDLRALFDLPLPSETYQKVALCGPRMIGEYADTLDFMSGDGAGAPSSTSSSSSDSATPTASQGAPPASCSTPGVSRSASGSVTGLPSEYEGTRIQTEMSNMAYDALLQSSVLFVRLVDASAVNTVLEAIRYGTPLFVNRHPAVEEYLGPDFPGYYETLAEASQKIQDMGVVEDVARYLERRNATDLNPSNFCAFVWQLLEFAKMRCKS